MKITILVETHAGVPAYEVTGDLLPELAPHLAEIATWIVHRDPMSGSYRCPWYHITNIESGRFISGAISRNKNLAIEMASSILATKTPEDILAVYKRWRLR